MKPFIQKIQTMGAGSLLLVALSVAPTTRAGPGPQQWQTLRGQEQFKQLKAGEKVAYVCNACKSISELAMKSPEHAMELCKEGATVMCPSCTKKAKIVMKRQRNDPPTHSEVVYVNEKGEECAFVAKVAGDK